MHRCANCGQAVALVEGRWMHDIVMAKDGRLIIVSSIYCNPITEEGRAAPACQCGPVSLESLAGKRGACRGESPSPDTQAPGQRFERAPAFASARCAFAISHLEKSGNVRVLDEMVAFACAADPALVQLLEENEPRLRALLDNPAFVEAAMRAMAGMKADLEEA